MVEYLRTLCLFPGRHRCMQTVCTRSENCGTTWSPRLTRDLTGQWHRSVAGFELSLPQNKRKQISNPMMIPYWHRWVHRYVLMAFNSSLFLLNFAEGSGFGGKYLCWWLICSCLKIGWYQLVLRFYLTEPRNRFSYSLHTLRCFPKTKPFSSYETVHYCSAFRIYVWK